MTRVAAGRPGHNRFVDLRIGHVATVEAEVRAQIAAVPASFSVGRVARPLAVAGLAAGALRLRRSAQPEQRRLRPLPVPCHHRAVVPGLRHDPSPPPPAPRRRGRRRQLEPVPAGRRRGRRLGVAGLGWCLASRRSPGSCRLGVDGADRPGGGLRGPPEPPRPALQALPTQAERAISPEFRLVEGRTAMPPRPGAPRFRDRPTAQQSTSKSIVARSIDVVARPVRQTWMVRIAAPGEGHPGVAHAGCQRRRLGADRRAAGRCARCRRRTAARDRAVDPRDPPSTGVVKSNRYIQTGAESAASWRSATQMDGIRRSPSVTSPTISCTWRRARACPAVDVVQPLAPGAMHAAPGAWPRVVQVTECSARKSVISSRVVPMSSGTPAAL